MVTLRQTRKARGVRWLSSSDSSQSSAGLKHAFLQTTWSYLFLSLCLTLDFTCILERIRKMTNGTIYYTVPFYLLVTFFIWPAPIHCTTSRVSLWSIGLRCSGAKPQTYAPIGIMTSRAGGWYPNKLYGRIWLYSCLHRSTSTFASSNVSNTSLESRALQRLGFDSHGKAFSLTGSAPWIPTHLFERKENTFLCKRKALGRNTKPPEAYSNPSWDV